MLPPPWQQLAMAGRRTMSFLSRANLENVNQDLEKIAQVIDRWQIMQ